MTKAEATENIKLIRFNAAITNANSFKEALDMAIEALSRPSLPSNLDEAAVQAAQVDMCDRQIMEDSNEHRMLYSRIFRRGFKAGAVWRDAQIQKLPDNLDEAAKESLPYPMGSLTSEDMPPPEPGYSFYQMVKMFKAGTYGV